jgi:hypothetical protein
MTRPWTERELKRMSRVLAGHARDKDRARRKRRLRGSASVEPVRKPRPEDLEDQVDVADDPQEDEAQS